MGIYINGVEMPRNNYIKLTLYPNGDYVSRTYDFRTGEILDEHLEFEAITEVSVPHGRLIDADALNRIYEGKRHEHSWQHDGDDWYVGVIDANDELINAPTIIESEV